MIAFRPADLTTGEDRAFIRSTWSRSFKQSHDAGMIYTDDWADVMHRQIDRVLDRVGARAVIAFEKDDPTFLYGWIAGDTSERLPVVFFAYVKEPYRRGGYQNGARVSDGYGRQLLEAFGVEPTKPFVYVCRTSLVRHLREKIPLARYNPNEVRYPKEARRGTWQKQP